VWFEFLGHRSVPVAADADVERAMSSATAISIGLRADAQPELSVTTILPA
jgi:hypothetical protein